MERLIHGDCLEVMRGLPDNSVDAVVTDPPYGLEFMGKEWDRLDVRQPNDPTFHKSGAGPFDRAKVRYSSAASYGGSVGTGMQEWHLQWARESLRVLKPGGYLLAFGGSRTYHRLACAVEDAGFEIRDMIEWLYGSGFPKSLDVSKAMDKAAGAERTEGAREWRGGQRSSGILGTNHGTQTLTKYDTPATDLARQWQGWGTALKPAHEPIVVARKPLIGTVAQNVERYGTGAINVDGCRVPAQDEETFLRPATHAGENAGWDRPWKHNPDGLKRRQVAKDAAAEKASSHGRFPANLCLDETAAAMLDEQSGTLTSGLAEVGSGGAVEQSNVYGRRVSGNRVASCYADSGGASRFFYTAKASSDERGPGNTHPTVKPLALMRWLVRLVTPPAGVVLDPFAGSGTTLVAALEEGFGYIGIEREEEYVTIARRRLEIAQPPLFGTD